MSILEWPAILNLFRNRLQLGHFTLVRQNECLHKRNLEVNAAEWKILSFFHWGRLDGDACQFIYYMHFHQGWEVAEPVQLGGAKPTSALFSPRWDRLWRNRSCTGRHLHHLAHGFLIACDSHCSRRTANKLFLCYTTLFWAGWWLSREAWLRGGLDLLQYTRKRHAKTVQFFIFCCVLSPVSVPQLPQPHGTSRTPRLWVQIWREGVKGLEITSPSHLFKR